MSELQACDILTKSHDTVALLGKNILKIFKFHLRLLGKSTQNIQEHHEIHTFLYLMNELLCMFLPFIMLNLCAPRFLG